MVTVVFRRGGVKRRRSAGGEAIPCTMGLQFTQRLPAATCIAAVPAPHPMESNGGPPPTSRTRRLWGVPLWSRYRRQAPIAEVAKMAEGACTFRNEKFVGTRVP